jgi:hypothetical protein
MSHLVSNVTEEYPEKSEKTETIKFGDVEARWFWLRFRRF